MLFGVGVRYQTFHGTQYPYTMSVWTSMRHTVFMDTSGHQIDYFFPSLGSFTTNVNVWAEPGTMLQPEVVLLQAQGGTHIHRVDSVRINGKRRSMLQADFHGLAGHYVEDQVSFSAAGRTWHLTASYDVRFRKLRPRFMRMLHTFRLQSTKSGGRFSL